VAEGRYYWMDLRRAAPRLEHRAFFYVHADEEDGPGGGDTDHEHAAPADGVEQQIIDEAGDEISCRIAALEEPRDGSAQPRRDTFHDEAGAEAPLAAHRNAEDEPEDQQ